MDKCVRKYKRQLKEMEYVEQFFSAREGEEITEAEYTDFDNHLKRQFNHYSDIDYTDSKK